MSDNHNLDGISAPELEETTYDPSKQTRHSLDGIAAPVLEDTYTPPTKSKPKGLDDIAAPVLEDTFTPPTNSSKSLDTVAAPTLAEDNYTPPVKETPKKDLSQVSGALLEEEEKVPEYKPKFVDPDLEKAKQEGAKKALRGNLDAEVEIDKEESLRMYHELLRERESEMAQKGGKTVIVMIVLGVIAAVCFTLFTTLTEFKDGAKEICTIVSDIALYYSIVVGVLSFLMILKSEAIRKLSSFVFGVTTVLTIFPGILILMSKENMGLTALFFIITLISSGYVTFTLGSNENVDKYYKGK